MLAPGNRTGGVSGAMDWETALGWQRRTGPESGVRTNVMTGLGRAGDSWRPRLTSSFSAVREAIGGPNCCGAACPSSVYFSAARGGCLTSKRCEAGAQVTPAQRSPGVVSRAPASFTIVPSRGSRPARSSSEISVRWRSQRLPSSSWEMPAAVRARRRLAANRS
jgi:hypothetical protein